MDADAVELRVLGSLIEKQRTTPDQYPLSLNGLRLACNQATNREPVVDYDEATIRAAIDKLSRRGWVRLASGPGIRVGEVQAPARRRTRTAPAQIALLAVLMLRGPQTPGELKQRVERLHPYASLDDVQKALDALAEAELVERLPRRPGQSQDRYVQLLGGGGTKETAPRPRSGRAAAPPEIEKSSLEERVARLEEQVAELQRTTRRALKPLNLGLRVASSSHARRARSLGLLGELRARHRSPARSGGRLGPLDRTKGEPAATRSLAPRGRARPVRGGRSCARSRGHASRRRSSWLRWR